MSGGLLSPFHCTSPYLLYMVGFLAAGEACSSWGTADRQSVFWYTDPRCDMEKT